MDWLHGTELPRWEVILWAFIFTLLGGFFSYWTGLFVSRLISFHRNRIEAGTQFIRSVNQLMRLGFFGIVRTEEQNGKSREISKTPTEIKAEIGYDQLSSHLNAFVRDRHDAAQAALTNAIALLHRNIEILVQGKCLMPDEIEKLHTDAEPLAEQLFTAKPRKRVLFSPLWKHI